MINKKKILIVLGGISKEREISKQTGQACFKALLKERLNVSKCDLKRNFKKTIRSYNPDIILNCLHGKFGEDGKVQAIFENLKIPYTHSGPKSSKIAMDKILSKKIFNKNKILTPNYKIIKKINDLKNNISLKKFVIKPINEGSSVDVSIFDKLNEISKKKIFSLIKKYKVLLQEEYIEGKEVQAAVLVKKSIGAIEIKPKRKFYDYKAKYNSKAKTRHIMPANLKKNIYKKVNQIAFKAHKLIGCRGVTRSDFRVKPNGDIFILEINTQPGMTKLSLVPEIAQHYGLSFSELLYRLLKDASTKR